VIAADAAMPAPMMRCISIGSPRSCGAMPCSRQLWGLALTFGYRHAVAPPGQGNSRSVRVQVSKYSQELVGCYVLTFGWTYGKVLLSARSECLSRWG
jgi:hypothetical protein